MYKVPENKYGWKPDKERGNRHQRGYGNEWDKIRQYVLQMNLGMCSGCLDNGQYTKATQIDHIIPKAKGGSDDIDNLQPLCEPCHKLKTARDKGHKPRLGSDSEGFPVDPTHHWNSNGGRGPG